MVVLNREAVELLSAREETDAAFGSHDETMRVERFRVAKSVENESDPAIAALASSVYVAKQRLTPPQRDSLVFSLLALSSSPASARSFYELLTLNRRLTMPDHAW